jgi:hypothetical protein
VIFWVRKPSSILEIVINVSEEVAASIFRIEIGNDLELHPESKSIRLRSKFADLLLI